jgi:toxin ParE1/3/4
MRVRLTHAARADLREIAIWISSDSVRQAEKFVDSLITKALSLDRLALRYPLIARGDLRRMPFKGYLIFYRVTDHVEILRILHGARDWASLLDDGD